MRISDCSSDFCSSDLFATPGRHVAVDGVVAGVQLAAGEPAAKRFVRVVQHPIPRPGPVDLPRRRSPEPLRVLHGGGVDLIETTHGVLLSLTPSSAPQHRAHSVPGYTGRPAKKRETEQRG